LFSIHTYNVLIDLQNFNFGSATVHDDVLEDTGNKRREKENEVNNNGGHIFFT